MPHPDRIPGNEAVRLITPDGAMNEGVAGNMAATSYLKASPYIMQALAEIGAVWGRARLMRLAPGMNVPPHVDTNFYWRKHLRIHIPIITTPDVLFTCNDKTVHMAAGECWTFDTFSMHHVVNRGAAARTHLVVDTVGGDQLWDLVARGRAAASDPSQSKPKFVRPDPTRQYSLQFERAFKPAIMTQWELRYHINFAAEHAVGHPRLEAVLQRMDRFIASWAAVSARFGDAIEGTQHFQQLINGIEKDLTALGGETIMLTNKLPLYRQIVELLHNARKSLPRTVTPSITAVNDRSPEMAINVGH